MQFNAPIPLMERSGSFLIDLARRVPDFGTGLQLQAAGQAEKAREVFRALAERPELTAPCMHQLGVIAAFAGDNARALGLLENAIKIEPSEPLYYFGLATLLERLGNIEQAVSVLMSLAIMLQTRGSHDDAVSIYKKILSLRPTTYSAWVNMGTGYAWLGKPRESLIQLMVGLVLYGRIVPELRELSEKLVAHLGTELPELTAALAMLPAEPPAGVLERADEVLQTLDKTLRAAGFGDDTHMCLKVALRLAPGNPLARWNNALACLSNGEFEEGWSDYEWRWVWDQFPEPRRVLPARKWNGEPLAGRRIYIWGEQGFGDILQFAPLVWKILDENPDVAVALEVTEPLVSLIQAGFGTKVQVVPRMNNPHQFSVEQQFDYHCALMSLPHLLALRVEDLPLSPGWLRPTDSEAQRGAELLPAANGKERIGIVWAGRPEHSDDAQRSLPLSYLGAILALKPDAEWISLQIGARSSEFMAFGDKITDMSQKIGNFADTAAILANLDHVITIDTAVGHLAGAMGVPVSLLLAYSTDWRWGLAEHSTPWYPRHKVYQQKTPGDWNEVIARLGVGLANGHAIATEALSSGPEKKAR